MFSIRPSYPLGLDIKYRLWAIYENGVYDLTDYVNTVTINQGDTAEFAFLNVNLSDLFEQQPGQDITHVMNAVLAQMDTATRDDNMACLQHAFYVGETDFRKTARCQAQNYLLLIFSGVLVTSMALKCKFLCLSSSFENS